MSSSKRAVRACHWLREKIAGALPGSLLAKGEIDLEGLCLWSSGCWTGLYFEIRAEGQKDMGCPETVPPSALPKVRGLIGEVVVPAPNSAALENEHG